MKIAIASIAAGLAIFFWGFISWTVLPWHNTDVEKFTDQTAVMQAMLENAPSSGIYYIPGDQADYQIDTPAAFVNVMKEGYGVGMGGMMVNGIIGNIIMALLAVLLVSKTSGLGYMQKVGFVTLAGLLIGIAANHPYWNWFGFPSGYTLVNIVDSVITWFLAGLVIAKLAPES